MKKTAKKNIKGLCKEAIQSLEEVEKEVPEKSKQESSQRKKLLKSIQGQLKKLSH